MVGLGMNLGNLGEKDVGIFKLVFKGFEKLQLSFINLDEQGVKVSMNQ